MKKLLYITTVFDPGAIPNIILDMVPVLRKAGWEPEVLTLQNWPKDRAALDRAQEMGLKVSVLGKKVWQIPGTLRALAKFIRRSNPQIIHSHLGRADILTAWAKPREIPQISTFHSVRRNFSRATLWGFQVTDHLVAHRTGVSQAALDSLYAEGYLTSPHSVIYNPVDPKRLLPDRTREEVRSRWGVSSEVPVILNVGRFVEAKGQIYLIEALPALQKFFPALKVVMAGSGPLEAVLKNRAEVLGLTSSIIWEGFSAGVPDLLQGADVLVFPSLWEGMGLVPLEALLRSKPVALSDIPAVKEFIPPGPAAEYFTPGNPETLASAVTQLLNQDQNSIDLDLLNRLPELVVRFSAETVAAQYLALYDQVLEGKK